VPEPVSWLVIEQGWRVVDADGEDVGKVEEIVGDTNLDIFNGLTIAHGMFARGQYVPAEAIAGITEGCVRLQLRKPQVEQLPEHREPPPSERILPE
jgi:uncharacterized protein YrrD